MRRDGPRKRSFKKPEEQKPLVSSQAVPQDGSFFLFGGLSGMEIKRGRRLMLINQHGRRPLFLALNHAFSLFFLASDSGFFSSQNRTLWSPVFVFSEYGKGHAVERRFSLALNAACPFIVKYQG